ncbi:MAG TPA: cytochrome ubiquinol oxidase subunit I, partial [Steroidobacteraceae bacterium]|nr:cytochrome ubiquinol oxidase subunit I [Steroidobacteraceae bacterium]
VSAWYLLTGRHQALAKRSLTVAASFGLASALSVVVLGDESGYTATINQKMKIAAIEAMGETETPPASFTLYGIPDQARHITRDPIRIPWLLGLIATRSLDEPVQGINQLVAAAEQRIRNGLIGYRLLADMRQHPEAAISPSTQPFLDDLGYALLLKRYAADIASASDAQIHQAALDTVPDVLVLFWAFRVMVACGLYFILLFALAFYLASRRRIEQGWFLGLALVSLPLPWIAAELGWIVAEYGRQPWVVESVLPTFLGASTLPAGNVWLSIAGFVLFYSTLAIVDVYLMVKYIRIGPEPSPASDSRAAPALGEGLRR